MRPHLYPNNRVLSANIKEDERPTSPSAWNEWAKGRLHSTFTAVDDALDVLQLSGPGRLPGMLLVLGR